MPLTLIKQSPKLYMTTLSKYLEPLSIVLITSQVNPCNYVYFRHHLGNNFEVKNKGIAGKNNR